MQPLDHAAVGIYDVEAIRGGVGRSDDRLSFGNGG